MGIYGISLKEQILELKLPPHLNAAMTMQRWCAFFFGLDSIIAYTCKYIYISHFNFIVSKSPPLAHLQRMHKVFCVCNSTGDWVSLPREYMRGKRARRQPSVRHVCMHSHTIRHQVPCCMCMHMYAHVHWHTVPNPTHLK